MTLHVLLRIVLVGMFSQMRLMCDSHIILIEIHLKATRLLSTVVPRHLIKAYRKRVATKKYENACQDAREVLVQMRWLWVGR